MEARCAVGGADRRGGLVEGWCSSGEGKGVANPFSIFGGSVEGKKLRTPAEETSVVSSGRVWIC